MTDTGPASGRLLSLDAMRGLTIIGMILVNNPGRWGADFQFAWMRHAAWHGCTPTDLVFPFFLFMVGVAVTLSLGKRRDRGDPRGPVLARIARRALVLFALGLFLNGFPFLPDPGATFASLRIPGVLQRIAVCYLLASLVFLSVPRRGIVPAAAVCLLAWWALLTLVPVPGQGPPDLDRPDGHLGSWADLAVFGSEHVWRSAKVYDPEGLLSTLGALGTTLLGVVAGGIVRRGRGVERTALDLMVAGAFWLLAGQAWSAVLPINKPIWTSSYAAFTGGLAFGALGLCVWLFDLHRHPRVGGVLRTYGVNALTVFVLSGVLARTLNLLRFDAGGTTHTPKSWLYSEVLTAVLPPKAASLAYGLLWVAVFYPPLRLMQRRGWILRA